MAYRAAADAALGHRSATCGAKRAKGRVEARASSTSDKKKCGRPVITARTPLHRAGCACAPAHRQVSGQIRVPVAGDGVAVIVSTMKFLQLNFLPRSADLALLLLRVWHGGALLLLHGWGKLTGFSAMADRFVDPFGIGKTPSLVLALGGELVCASLLALGLFTRLAALGAGATMTTAFWFVHGSKLTGPGNGEMAFLYLGVCLALFIAGPGKFSVDARLGGKT